MEHKLIITIAYLSTLFPNNLAGISFERLSKTSSDLVYGGFVIGEYFTIETRIQCASISQGKIETKGFGFFAQPETDYNCYTFMKSDFVQNTSYLLPNYEHYIKNVGDLKTSTIQPIEPTTIPTPTTGPPEQAPTTVPTEPTPTTVPTESRPTTVPTEPTPTTVPTEPTPTTVPTEPTPTTVPTESTPTTVPTESTSTTVPSTATLQTTVPADAGIKCPYMYRGDLCSQLCAIQIATSVKDVVSESCNYRSWKVSLNSSRPYPLIDCWEICAWDQSCWGVTYDLLKSVCYLITVDLDDVMCSDDTDKNFVHYHIKCTLIESSSG